MSEKLKYSQTEIEAVCAERNCSPAAAVEILDAAAWHKAQQDGRAKNAAAATAAKKTATPPPATS